MATGNGVLINGGTVNGTVYGGWIATGTATNNIVTISGNATLATTTQLYGGYRTGASGDVFTGNTLNLKTSETVHTLQNFQFINFTLPGSIAADNKTLLTVTNTLNYGKPTSGDTTGKDITLDIRTPGSFFLDGNSLGGDAGKTYTLLSSPSELSFTDAGANHIKTYSLYGAAFTKNGSSGDCDSTETCKVLLPSGGRVEGTFMLSLANDNKDLQLTVGNDYQAPNTALTWTEGSGLWANYSTDIDKSPKNWKGKSPSMATIASRSANTSTVMP
jgi:hypothetical protein